MKRGEFLKKLGIGVGAVVVAPSVTFSNQKSPVKVTALNPKENHIEGLVVTPPQHPCLGDHCVENTKKWRKWYIKGKENRHGYGLPDKTMLVLAPLGKTQYRKRDPIALMPYPKPVPVRLRISVHEFNRRFTITKRNIEKKHY